jgi:hypothetical protein
MPRLKLFVVSLPQRRHRQVGARAQRRHARRDRECQRRMGDHRAARDPRCRSACAVLHSVPRPAVLGGDAHIQTAAADPGEGLRAAIAAQRALAYRQRLTCV